MVHIDLAESTAPDHSLATHMVDGVDGPQEGKGVGTGKVGMGYWMAGMEPAAESTHEAARSEEQVVHKLEEGHIS